MDFEEQKEKSLSWKDLSKKGGWDEAIKPLLETINSLDDFYTTSSCAGRIDILSLSESKRKDEAEWLYMTHDLAEFEPAREALSKFSGNIAWFKMESAIIHVCCRELDGAIWLLNKAKEAGFKHSGILSISKRIIVEIFGSEKLETIIAKNDKILITDDYLSNLIIEANSKLKETRRKINKLKKIIKT